MTKRDKAMRTAVLLLRKAECDNPHEAAAFAAKAQEILDRYDIEAASLDLEHKEHDPINDEPIEDFYRKGSPLDTGKRLAAWKGRLAMTIARYNACKVYRSGGNLALIGRASDAETVRYLYAFLTKETDRLCNRDGRGMGTVWRNNFRIGVVEAVSETFKAQRELVRKRVRREAEDKGGNALVLVNNAIAKVDNRRAEVARWTRENIRLVSGRGGSARYSNSGRSAGRKAGAEINVGGSRRGISGSTNRPKLTG